MKRVTSKLVTRATVNAFNHHLSYQPAVAYNVASWNISHCILLYGSEQVPIDTTLGRGLVGTRNYAQHSAGGQPHAHILNTHHCVLWVTSCILFVV